MPIKSTTISSHQSNIARVSSAILTASRRSTQSAKKSKSVIPSNSSKSESTRITSTIFWAQPKSSLHHKSSRWAKASRPKNYSSVVLISEENFEAVNSGRTISLWQRLAQEGIGTWFVSTLQNRACPQANSSSTILTIDTAQLCCAEVHSKEAAG